MAKNIVFCADGIWNYPEQANSDDPNSPKTNVFKVFVNLAGTDALNMMHTANEFERTLIAPDGTVEQIAKYLLGVGDPRNQLARAAGGRLDAGLITQIVRGYTFISRNYLPGDKIFLVGFSRGAYTARALAGLIGAKGLIDSSMVDLSNKGAAYQTGAEVWYQWRREVWSISGNGRVLTGIERIASSFPGLLQVPPDPKSFVNAPIEGVGVWETVGSLGIPEFVDQQIAADVFRFADTVLPRTVCFGLQAISLDERRADFSSAFWDPDPRVTQVLFPGSHGDVGGGYPLTNNESGLSDCALVWMTHELISRGVRFSASPAIVPAADPIGPAHQPWEHSPWTLLARRDRHFPLGLIISQAAWARRIGSKVTRLLQTNFLIDPSEISGRREKNTEAPEITALWLGTQALDSIDLSMIVDDGETSHQPPSRAVATFIDAVLRNVPLHTSSALEAHTILNAHIIDFLVEQEIVIQRNPIVGMKLKDLLRDASLPVRIGVGITVSAVGLTGVTTTVSASALAITVVGTASGILLIGSSVTLVEWLRRKLLGSEVTTPKPRRANRKQPNKKKSRSRAT